MSAGLTAREQEHLAVTVYHHCTAGQDGLRDD